MRRRNVKSAVKVPGSTGSVPLILMFLNAVKVGGMWCVAVKCIDMPQNSDSEGSLLVLY